MNILHLLDEQAKWIEQHGGSLPAYVQRYGSIDDAEHYGNGGEAIYAADVGEYRKLQQVAIKRRLLRR